MTDQLSLGGMHLVNNHGDIDIYVTGQSTIIPATRLQRADLPEILDFIDRARKGADD